jgi:hypothetical protein
MLVNTQRNECGVTMGGLTLTLADARAPAPEPGALLSNRDRRNPPPTWRISSFHVSITAIPPNPANLAF